MKGGHIKLSSLEPQVEPANLLAMKAELAERWPMTGLLDMFKETALRVGFTQAFRSATAWENIDEATLQHRILLCLYGLPPIGCRAYTASAPLHRTGPTPREAPARLLVRWSHGCRRSA